MIWNRGNEETDRRVINAALEWISNKAKAKVSKPGTKTENKAMKTVVSIGEFFDSQNREMNPRALAAIVNEVKNQTIKKWGQGLKLGDFEVLISGGVRYLQSGKRKDVDIVFNFPNGLDKNTEASSIPETFIELFDEKLRSLKGIKGYKFENVIFSDVGEIKIIGFAVSDESQERYEMPFDFIYPKRIKQRLKFETDNGGKYLNSPEEIVLEGIQSNLGQGISTLDGRPYFRMSLKNMKNYLAAEYYFGRDTQRWGKYRPLFLKVDESDDMNIHEDQDLENKALLALIGPKQI